MAESLDVKRDAVIVAAENLPSPSYAPHNTEEIATKGAENAITDLSEVTPLTIWRCICFVILDVLFISYTTATAPSMPKNKHYDI